MAEKKPTVLWFNLRGDKNTLADVRSTIVEIKELLPRAAKMYLDVPEKTQSIFVVQAAVHLYLDCLKSAVEEIESRPKRSLGLWAKKED